MPARYIFPELPVHSHLADSLKSAFSPVQWQLLFRDLLVRYPNHTAVYCDGSVRGDTVGCGVWSPDFQLLCRLPPGASILTAELYAILSAITFVSSLPGSFIILSDSLSSIYALRFSHAPRNYLVEKISSALVALPAGKLSLEWVPSHMGIPGNERADGLAAQSLLLPSIASVHLPLPDIKRILTSHYYTRWQTAWSNRHRSITAHKPLLGPTAGADLPRRDQICITRLRFRTCSLTHKHYFTNTPPTACASCQCRMSLHHLLLACPAFAPARRPLLDECLRLGRPAQLNTLLDPAFPVSTLLNFLRATSYLDEI